MNMKLSKRDRERYERAVSMGSILEKPDATKPKKPESSFDFEKVLFHFSSEGGKIPFYVRDSFASVAIFGATSSGKTSGPGEFYATKYLAAGYGGLVLTTKPTDKDDWIRYARATGRENDLIIVEPIDSGGKAFFDFLHFESTRSKGGIYLQNVADTLKAVIRTNEEKNSGSTKDEFFDSALDQLVFFTLEICMLAHEKLDLQTVYEIAISAPKAGTKPDPRQPKTAYVKAFEAAQMKVNGDIFTYIDHSLSIAEKEKIKNVEYFESLMLKVIPDAKRLRMIDQFFNETYKNLSDKTRSIVEFSWTGFLFTLMQEPIYSLFCGNASTFTPEDCWKGKVIILALPTLIYDKAGRSAQLLFKYTWQKVMQKRTPENGWTPVFHFADEAQGFVTEHDAKFLTTCRSSGVANVFLSQNLPNYHAFMGGDSHKIEHKVKSLMGNFATKIFACNTCTATNQWASDLCGSGYTENISRSSTISGDFSSSQSFQYTLEPMVRPELFGRLLQGGPKNGCIVETIVHRQGELFDNGHNFKKVIFKQK